MENTIIIDLETGGTNPKTDAICSITAKVYGKDIVKTWYVKPYNKRYSKEALEVNGLTLDFLEKNGVDLSLVLTALRMFIRENFGNTNPKPLGHNVRFDLNFLNETCDMLNCGFSHVKHLLHYHYKDSMIIAEFLRDANILNLESLKLTAIYEELFSTDELLEKAHTSEADVLMCEKVYDKFRGLASNEVQ